MQSVLTFLISSFLVLRAWFILLQKIYRERLMCFCFPFPSRYTFRPKEGKVNAIFFNWPNSGILELGEPQARLAETQVKLVGYKEPLKWVALGEKGIAVALPQLTLKQLPCQWGWTLQLTDVNWAICWSPGSYRSYTVGLFSSCPASNYCLTVKHLLFFFFFLKDCWTRWN